MPLTISQWIELTSLNHCTAFTASWINCPGKLSRNIFLSERRNIFWYNWVIQNTQRTWKIQRHKTLMTKSLAQLDYGFYMTHYLAVTSVLTERSCSTKFNKVITKLYMYCLNICWWGVFECGASSVSIDS